MEGKSVVGDLINFRGLVYAPVNENGVVFLFGKIAHDLNMYVEEIKPGFPDCIARRFIGKGWVRVSIEFEYLSSNFKLHKHDEKGCNIIVCWEHDWKDCPKDLEVIELKTEIASLDNPPITRPGSSGKEKQDIDKNIEQILFNVDAIPEVKKWYDAIFIGITNVNDSIWAKIGTKYIGLYCPEKAFASIVLNKQSMRIECFSGDNPIPGTKTANKNYSPRWCKYTVKTDSSVPDAIKILKESYTRINKAIKNGEITGYFSGGKPFSNNEERDEEDIDSENISSKPAKKGNTDS